MKTAAIRQNRIQIFYHRTCRRLEDKRQQPMHDGGKPAPISVSPNRLANAMLAMALTHAVRMVEEGSFDIYA
jgi:hypothetical protein